jgi:hypothetical protein
MSALNTVTSNVGQEGTYMYSTFVLYEHKINTKLNGKEMTS